MAKSSLFCDGRAIGQMADAQNRFLSLPRSDLKSNQSTMHRVKLNNGAVKARDHVSRDQIAVAQL